MKSKVLTLPFVCFLCFDFCFSKPTFGDEFVHIKVHLPKECSGDDVHHHHQHHPPHGPPIHAHPHVHAPPIHHNVVHHYHHRRRRPAKRPPTFGKHAGLLESIILSEVKKPLGSDHYKFLNHANDIAKHVDTFIVKPEKPRPQIETYKLIEESSKPKGIEETFKVIESKVPAHHHSSHDFEEHDFVGSFEEGAGYHYKPHKKVESFKVIDGLLDDYHTHVQNTAPNYLPTAKKQRFKTVIDEPFGGGVGHSSHSSYDFGSQEYGSLLDDSYHYATKPHAESVKIVETKSPQQQSQELSINFDKRPHSETVEIFKSNKPAKSSSYYKRPQHQHFDDNSQGYHYPRPSSFGGTAIEDDEAFDYKTPKYVASYGSLAEDHYTPPPADSYLPPKRPSSSHNNHRHQTHHNHHQTHQSNYASSLRQNSLHDAESASVTSPKHSYLPPALPAIDASSSTAADTTHWSPQDTGHKATETYTGIDSYSADHVQGLGSGGYQYPQPYP